MKELEEKISKAQQKNAKLEDELNAKRHEKAKQKALEEVQGMNIKPAKSQKVTDMEQRLRAEEKKIADAEKKKHQYFGSPVHQPVAPKLEPSENELVTPIHENEPSTSDGTSTTVPNFGFDEELIAGLRRIGKLQSSDIQPELAKILPKPVFNQEPVTPRGSDPNIDLKSPPRVLTSITSPASKAVAIEDLSSFLSERNSTKKHNSRTNELKSPKSRSSPASRSLFLESTIQPDPSIIAHYKDKASQRMIAIQVLNRNLKQKISTQKSLAELDLILKKHKVTMVNEYHKIKDSFFWIIQDELNESSNTQTDSHTRLRRRLMAFIGMNELNFTRVSTFENIS